MKLLLLLFLFPVCVSAQEVSPVVSKDYLNLIRNDGSAQKNGPRADTTNSIRMASLLSPGYDNGQVMRKITIKQHSLTMKPLVQRSLLLGGSFNSTVEIKRINQLPALQSQYVQGRSVNGALAWRGPETGELFSYGPAVNTLEFDGSSYPYDVNGRLAATGTGNGHAANAYSNSIFRTASLTAQTLGVQGKYFVAGTQLLAGSLRVGQTHENTFIKDNKNNSQSLLASAETNIGWLNITGAYNYMQNRFSNSNRNGFLNRVYQNALLSPVSFDNSQGNTIGNRQRSYSNAADNPFFLLEDNGHAFLQSHKTASLALERKFGLLRFKVAQSLEKLVQNSN
ncbi:MAG TPA: hypothetical protein VLD19_15875, partial [Chitinophagaceae bacterium]|nr:hypothetical protein [Chitinophagaceae bacterium]